MGAIKTNTPQASTAQSTDPIIGTWETMGPVWDSGSNHWESSGTFSTLKVTQGKTPYKTYFTLVKDIVDSKSNTSFVTYYADSNNNGIFDPDDGVTAEATVKTTDSTLAQEFSKMPPKGARLSGTFQSAANSKTANYLLGGQSAAVAPFPNSPWGAVLPISGAPQQVIGQPEKNTPVTTQSKNVTGIPSNKAPTLNTPVVSATKPLPSSPPPSGIIPASPSNRPQQSPAKPISSGASSTRTQPITTAPSGGIPNSTSNRPQPTPAPAIAPSNNAPKTAISPVKPPGSNATLPNSTQRIGNTASVTVVDSSRTPTPAPTTDPITGQITFSDLGTVVSDRVYGKDSRWLQPIVNNTPFTQQDMDRLTNFNIEFEFNNQYIVATAVVRGDTRQPISQYMGSDWTARMVLRGNFSYSGGRLTSASIDSGAVQLISQSTPNSIGSGQLISITPNIGISSAPVSDPTSWSSFRRVTSFGDSPLANIRGLGYSPLSPENTTATINALQGFGGGRFFYSGWETNPFNSNLI